MIKSLFQKLLARSGKTYTIDPEIPGSLAFLILSQRAMMMTRGFLKTGKKVFIGNGVCIRNGSNLAFGKNVTIEKRTTIDGYARKKMSLGNNVKIGAYSTISCTSHLSKYGVGLSVGDNSAIGEYSYFGASGGILIGSDVIMGQYISFHSENHNFSDSTKLIREQGVTSKGISIGNNVWVGAKATFLDGCVVGDNSVVAAGAVVNGIYPDNCIIGGVPAKILKEI
jgi:acetyltransferase-like isoleucine patch superfamily enzyme